MKYRILHIGLLLVLVISIVTSCSKEVPETASYGPMPDDFNFSLEYGVNGRQLIDTFHHIVIKDLVEDGTAKATITLTKEEMEAIYEKMVHINMMGKPDLEDLEKNYHCGAEPGTKSDWKVQMNDEIVSIQYTNEYCEPPNDIIALYRLEDYIHSLVIQKEAYKKLPEANGYYE